MEVPSTQRAGAWSSPYTLSTLRPDETIDPSYPPLHTQYPSVSPNFHLLIAIVTRLLRSTFLVNLEIPVLDIMYMQYSITTCLHRKIFRGLCGLRGKRFWSLTPKTWTNLCCNTIPATRLDHVEFEKIPARAGGKWAVPAPPRHSKIVLEGSLLFRGF